MFEYKSTLNSTIPRVHPTLMRARFSEPFGTLSRQKTRECTTKINKNAIITSQGEFHPGPRNLQLAFIFFAHSECSIFFCKAERFTKCHHRMMNCDDRRYTVGSPGLLRGSSQLERGRTRGRLVDFHENYNSADAAAAPRREFQTIWRASSSGDCAKESRGDIFNYKLNNKSSFRSVILSCPGFFSRSTSRMLHAAGILNCDSDMTADKAVYCLSRAIGWFKLIFSLQVV